jgi:hypothetical protein
MILEVKGMVSEMRNEQNCWDKELNKVCFYSIRGEVTSDSSSDAKNSNVSPNNKAKLGHKVDFKLSLKKPNYKLQIVHGEISGGIKDGKTATCKRKQWLDKLKLMVRLRDELNQLIKTYNKLGCAEFLHLVVYGVQVVGMYTTFV